MQNVGQNDSADAAKDVKSVEVGQASMTPSNLSVMSMENGQVLTGISEQQNFIELSASEEEEVSEVESFILDQEELDEGESVLDTSKFLLASENLDGSDLRSVDPETQAKLEALLEAAGIGKLSTADGKAFADPEVLRRLTSSVSCALDEAAQALTRMRAEQQGDSVRSLAEACSDGDITTVRKLLDEGRSVHETTEEGESLLSLACSAGYHELAQVLLAMRANVEDRGIKGDCTPLMEAASGGHVDIVKLLIEHGADVNAQSSAGNTPLHYAACGGYESVVMVLLMNGANEEEHNENGHTPLMEAASAGHVEVARTLLKAGAGINTHSNEFKESALTLACYKGHLEMVKFLLEAGADQEHKTDEMHTALMEASMDGHVEVARLLLDSGAQVNMPADSFESPLTLAACGGHVELANLLIERGANLEEVNDEGYTPLMEAAREGHEEMVALLLAHGADINAQTEETQETALTLACCGGFQEVAEFLITKAGADIELGCSTPLMEAAQEGHLDLVKFLIEQNAKVNAQTGTGDTALTYACENGHTDVADVLLKAGADLEHESEGGRTPLMKAARAGHLCTVQFLISKGADVNRQTSTNDHTVLSLACAGGHMSVVELLLTHAADPTHKLKDGSTMLIEAAKGGHTAVVNLLLEWPNSVLSPQPDLTQITPPDHTNINELPRVPMQGLNNIVPPQDPDQIPCPTAMPVNLHTGAVTTLPGQLNLNIPPTRSTEQIRQNMQKSLMRNKQLPKDHQPDLKKQNNLAPPVNVPTLISAPAPSPALMTAPSLHAAPMPPMAASTAAMVPMSFPVTLPIIPPTMADTVEGITTLGLESEGFDFEKALAESTAVAGGGEGEMKLDPKTSEKCEKLEAFINNMMRKAELLNTTREEQIVKKQQILEELQKVERELHEKAQAQLLFNFQQRLEQSPLAMSAVTQLPGTQLSPAQLQQLQQQQQRLEQLQPGGASPLLQVPLPVHTLPLTPMQPLQPIQLPMVTPDNLLLTKNTRNSEMSLESAGNGAHGSEGATHGDMVATPPPPPVREKKKAKRSLKLHQHNQQSPQSPLSAASAESSPNMKPGSDGAASSGPSLEASPTHNGAGSEASSPAKMPTHMEQKQGSRASSEEVDLSSVTPASMEAAQSAAKQPKVEMLLPAATPPISMMTPTTSAADSTTSLSKAASTLPTIQWDLSDIADINAMPLCEPQPFVQFTDQTRANYTTIQQVQADYQQKLQLQEYQAQMDAHQQLHQHVAMTLAHQQHQQHVVTATASQLQLHELQAKFSLANQMPQPLVQCGLTQQELLAQTQQLQQLQVSNDMWLKQQPMAGAVRAAGMPAQTLPVSHAHKQAFTLATGQQLQPMVQQVPVTQPLNLQQANLIQSTAPAPPKKAKKKLGPMVPPTMLPQATPLLSPQYPQSGLHTLDTITPPPSTPMTPNPSPVSLGLPNYSSLELDAQTESNHDTALTFACAGGHSDLVSLLLSRGADIEHRDKKGFTPLILAATAGHADVVEILLDHGADIEAQSERTKDTPLSLACSGGRYEVVEFLLARGANKEHRNVSDYTPLSLAASGGYVNIIKLLLSHGAEINSRTGSKLGISPLMLAAMNGHTAAVRLLLDMGSDINAQIETNRNTALTLACFQGRHEVVSLLVDRKANIEHRAKTGLTPLMEAASGGYVEVGRVLLDKVADVNAPPVPSSRDTALTIAADKGHLRFVELLLQRGAAVDVKNKKGNSPLWLACNGGHLDVVQLLVNASADVDSQDNRKVSCLMAAFRKGHVKVVRWLVKHVTQFPSDTECMRYIATITDKELLKKCHQCMEILVSAKDRQAAQANKNASILLEELDLERSREESKKAALARKRERRRRKKKEKQEKEQREREEKGKDDPEKVTENGSKNSSPEPEDDKDEDEEPDDLEPAPEPADVPCLLVPDLPVKERETTPAAHSNRQAMRNNSKRAKNEANANASSEANSKSRNKKNKRNDREREREKEKEREKDKHKEHDKSLETNIAINQNSGNSHSLTSTSTTTTTTTNHNTSNKKNRKEPSSSSGIGELDDFGSLPNPVRNSPRDKDKNSKDRLSAKVGPLDGFSVQPMLSPMKNNSGLKSPGLTSPKRVQKTEEGWKEVTRKPVNFRSKKVMVPSSAVSRVIGRGGSNINAIREVSGAHIELDKHKGAGDRSIMIKGSVEAIRQAHNLIAALVKDPDKELEQLLPKGKQKPVGSATTSSNTFSSNMWHNSMANNIPASTNVGTLGPSSAPGTPALTHSQNNKANTAGSAARPPNAATTTASLMGPFANVVKQNSSSATTPTMAAPSGSPKKIGPGMMKTTGPPSVATMQAFSASNPIEGKSPGCIARELFPKESSTQPPGSTNKTTLTYCTSAMTSTKVVTSCSPSFAAKVDNRSLLTTQTPQQVRPPGKPVTNAIPQGPVMRPDMGSAPLRSNMAPTRPNLSMSVPQAPSRPHIPQAPSAPQHAAAIGAPEFSPFNNRLSGVAERVLGKKEDFASIVAAGVAPSTVSNLMNMAPPPTESKSDPSLEAKAPGYKLVGQRTSSPQVNEAELAKAPGYRGNNPVTMGGVGTVGPLTGNRHLPGMDTTSMYQHFMQMTNRFEPAPNRAPGFKPGGPGGGEMMDPAARAPGYTRPLLQAELSPRSASNPAGMGIGIGPTFDTRPVQDEYSTPNQPMTLPKIESTLNPNAPDFTSRTPDYSARSPLLQQQYLLQQFSNLGPMVTHGSGLTPGMRAQLQNNPFLGMPDTNMLAFLASPGMSAPSPAQRQLSPGPPGGPPTGLQGAPSSQDSPIPSAPDQCPASGGAPSPTDGSSGMGAGEDRQLPRPIGTGRSSRKMAGLSGASGPEPAQQYWAAFPQDLDGVDWMGNSGLAAVTTVLATTVVTSAIMSPAAMSQDGEQRPASMPSVMSPHLLAGGFGADPPMEPNLDAHLQLQLQQRQLLMSASNSAPPTVLTNGLPPAGSANQARGGLFGPASMVADSSMQPWAHASLKTNTADAIDHKMMWNNWNNTNNL